MSTLLPLTGCRIIELTMYINGPMAASILGRLGAEIIKVERPGVGDPSRTSEAQNLAKRSVTADLTRPEGREVLYDLARRCDVLVTNLRPQTLRDFGADQPTLAAVKLVM